MSNNNILIAPNAFKECRNSVQVSELIYNNIRTRLPEFNIIRLPLSDGGDGFLESIKFIKKINDVSRYKLITYYDQLTDIPVIVSGDVLYIECANVIGLKIIPLEKRNPLVLTTAPLGKLLKKIDLDNKSGLLNVNKVVIGIGGTSTNDLGLGVCGEFGMKLFDSKGFKLDIIPDQYTRVNKIEWHKPDLSFQIELVVDVENPLVGETGASKVFASQKGADENGINTLENGFLNILNVLKNQEISVITDKLSGAGGGLAAGLKLFFDAGIKSASDFINHDLKLNNFVKETGYVITGEGSFDIQSLCGKTTGIILKTFRDIPVFLICGVFINDQIKVPENLTVIELLHYFKGKEESIFHFEEGIRLACEEIIKEIRSKV